MALRNKSSRSPIVKPTPEIIEKSNMSKPFTIRIFLPDGDPEGIRIISRMNWTGTGVVFPREKWHDVKKRSELQKAGIYILVGYQENDSDLQRIYIGQADGISNRIDDHIKSKDFWDWAICLVSESNNLNRAHVTWLEFKLITRAKGIGRCILDNNAVPQEPSLSEAEKADTQEFLDEILQILPLVGLRVFEPVKMIKIPNESHAAEQTANDTLIVPAQKEGFEEEFLGNKCWFPVRISKGRLNQIKYIAAYQVAPISAITHYAEVERIEPYGDSGKYKLVFKAAAIEITPIPFGNASKGTMQGISYTSFSKLQKAKQLTEALT